jgi:hypothetical protein
MSSSTSAFERAAATVSEASAEEPWRRWLFVYVGVLVGLTSFVFLAVVLLDPFSTGRLTPIDGFNIATKKRIFGHAGRIRNPRFNAAIIGNSRAFPIEPARLGELTGHRIVNLAMEGLWPPEQRFLLRNFVRHQRGRAPLIIMVLDSSWCESKRHHTKYELPRWLYEGSDLDYLRHIVSLNSAEAALVRAMILLGLKRDLKRLDGYDPWYPPDVAMMRQQMLNMPVHAGGEPVSAPFPNLDDLGEALAGVEPASPVILMFPPEFAGALAVPGSPAEARIDACKARVGEIAGVRQRTEFIDLWRDTPVVRDPMNFIDQMHFLDPVAQYVEGVLAPRIRRLAGRPDGVAK